MLHDVAANIPTQLYINGRWEASSEGTRIEVLNPATEEVIANVESASIADAMAALDAASKAAPAWAATAPRQRGEILRRAFELLTGRKDEYARMIVLENGKPFSEALGEVAYAAEFFRWYAEEAVRGLGDVCASPDGNYKVLALRQPVGISLLITPWNFPAAMGTRKIGPALAAGCTVICKPASETPLTMLALAGLLEEAGVPAGVVNIIPCNRSSKVIGALLQDNRIRKISFTGSTEVGSILLEQAAKRIVNCSMELGGNAPLIVFDDADLDEALSGTMIAKMRNIGESCIGANRIYVHSRVAEEFTARLAKAMAALKIGNGLEDGVAVGPLINAKERDRVASMVEGAVADGAKVLTGGKKLDRRGYFYEPTLLVNVNPSSRVLREEIFGPVAPVVVFEDTEDVIRQANDTEYGLAAYVFTRDLKRGLRVAERLESGMVGLNRGLISNPAAPFGGVKQSGLGREGAHDGLLEFMETKYIAVEW